MQAYASAPWSKAAWLLPAAVSLPKPYEMAVATSCAVQCMCVAMMHVHVLCVDFIGPRCARGSRLRGSLLTLVLCIVVCCAMV
jgi:hypothetical protein